MNRELVAILVIVNQKYPRSIGIITRAIYDDTDVSELFKRLRDHHLDESDWKWYVRDIY